MTKRQQEEFEWLTKEEVYRRAQCYLSLLAKTFELDVNDCNAGQATVGREEQLISVYRQIFPRFMYHHEEIPRFVREKVEVEKPKLQKGTPEWEQVCVDAAIDFCSELPLHENIHDCGDLTDEETTFKLMYMLMDGFKKMKFNSWHYLYCPNRGGERVSWDTCYKCKDTEKHPTCPFLALRKDAYPRQYEEGRYHVSELGNLRMSYYERVGEPYARDWQQYNPLLLGKALGWFIESLYKKEHHEIELFLNREQCQQLTTEPLPADFKGISAHQDLHLETEDGGVLVELKLYAFIGIMVRQRKAKPEHEQQARAYLTMGQILYPKLYGTVKKVWVTYYTKAKEAITKIDIEVPCEPVDMVTPALTLHKALTAKNPDLLPRCPPYLCGRITKDGYTGYCAHHDCTYHPQHENTTIKQLRKQ